MNLVPATGFAGGPQPGPLAQQGQAQQQPTAPTTGAQQQQMEQQQDMQQMGQQPTTQARHKTQTMLTGKIAMKNGQYVFENSTGNSSLTVENPKKVKKYAGDDVQVKGTVNQQAQTIRISKIKRAAS
jgi:FtsZ-interacting cell division protein YlmF